MVLGVAQEVVVMAGPVPAIHGFRSSPKTWMLATCAGMTGRRS